MRVVLILAFFCAFFLPSNGVSQELVCEVQIIRTQVQSVPEQVFTNIEGIIREFMNGRRWTNENFAPEERIECTVLLNIREVENNIAFRGTLQIQSSRPVYNSSYKTPVLNFIDEDFSFSFQNNTVVEFTPDIFRNNLTSIFGYYAYLIIGYDFETFGLRGGSRYFNIAQQVVSNAQGSGGAGWNAFDRNGRNRNALVDNILQPVFMPLRNCLYLYHRMGLDKMESDPEAGRKAIIEAVEGLLEIHQARPASYNQQLFFSAKVDELVNIFSSAPEEDKKRIMSALRILDPGNLVKYQKIEQAK
ncbi:MAG: type IX secretion system protein PorD [Luteibaculaceae bacterium]